MPRNTYSKDDEYRRLGFQASETSGVEVTFYSHGQDPILKTEDRTCSFAGTTKDQKPTIISATTDKTLGRGAGTFALEVKTSTRKAESIIEGFGDDDWVDIVFTRHGRKWHVMRGLIDAIQEGSAISGSGATVKTWSIIGRDFTKIWEVTPLWYDLQAAKPQGLDAQSELNAFGTENLSGLTPARMVQGMLFKLFEEQLNNGRGSWDIPSGMKGKGLTDSFITSVSQLFSGMFTGVEDDMQRVSCGLGSVASLVGNYFWDFITEYSDPIFCELFADVYPNGQFPKPGDEAKIEDSQMVVVFRDRPFLFSSGTGVTQKGVYWPKMDAFIVPRSQLANGTSLTRSGSERYNSYQCVSTLVQEAMNASTNIAAKPLWDLDDIKRHGLRRFDASTRFMALNADDQVQNSTNREVVRDWYCLNAYYRSGQLPLTHGRPDIRIGSKIVIPGLKRPDDDFNFYVEHVSHSWVFGRGLKTLLGVTRGWKGGDDDLQSKLNDVAGNYTVAGQY